MIVVVEETKRRLNYLHDHGCYRDHMTFRWGYRGVYYGSFVAMWKRLMDLEKRFFDWTPPLYYEHLDCDGCRDSHLIEISRAIKEALRRTINQHCTCGGRALTDPSCCSACRVWHELYTAEPKENA